MNNYRKHFDRELKILEDNLKRGDNLAIKDFIPDIESIIEKFGKQGHSGSSAPFYVGALSQAIKNTLLFMPLSSITGKDDEWNNKVGKELGKPECYQNNRCSAIFKEGKNGRPYYLDAIVWKGEESWDTFTGSIKEVSSRQYIKSFPFVPKTFYIDVIRVPYDKEKHIEKDCMSCGTGDFVYFIKDKKQLDEVWEYYEKKKD